MSSTAYKEIVLRDGSRIPGEFPVECRWITEQLAIGGMIGTAANMRALGQLGITHVLDLQAEFDDTPLVGSTGIQLCWLEIPDALAPFPEELLGAAITFAQTALAAPDRRLFVHCMAGRNRSPLFAYAILRALGESRIDALARIRLAEPAALLRDEYLGAVDRLVGD